MATAARCFVCESNDGERAPLLRAARVVGPARVIRGGLGYACNRCKAESLVVEADARLALFRFSCMRCECVYRVEALERCGPNGAALETSHGICAECAARGDLESAARVVAPYLLAAGHPALFDALRALDAARGVTPNGVARSPAA